MTWKGFLPLLVLLAVAAYILVVQVDNRYFFFAGYVVLQYVVLATAWNILGGYAGYANFGSGAFFAVGAYTSVFLVKAYQPSLPVLLLAGAFTSGLLGLGIGYLTLRMRGIYFSIATLVPAVNSHRQGLGNRRNVC